MPLMSKDCWSLLVRWISLISEGLNFVDEMAASTSTPSGYIEALFRGTSEILRGSPQSGNHSTRTFLHYALCTRRNLPHK